MTRILEYLDSNNITGNVTRVLLSAYDVSVSLLSRTLAIFIVYEMDTKSIDLLFSIDTLFLLFIRGISFQLFRTHAIILRFIGEKDLKNVFLAVSASTLVYWVLNSYLPSGIGESKRIPVVLVDYVICLLFTAGLRVSLRLFYDKLRRSSIKTNTVIFGAGEMGAIVEQLLRHNSRHNYKVAAFLDDNPKVHNKFLNGIPVYNPALSFQEVVGKYDIKFAIIAINHLSFERRRAFVEECLDNNIKVLKTPPSREWLDGHLHADQLKNINFEDLLERPSIKLEESLVPASITGKVVVVTGCAGSIGSEIVRQVLKHNPACLIGIDQAESPLAAITLELSDAVSSGVFIPVIGDVCNVDKMNRIFSRYSPAYVFHAAAYKHVPIMEIFPEEAVRVNVEGTARLADLSVSHLVEKFVMVSTDKVVNPANVMGASKRVAEIYVQSLNFRDGNATQFITTRFGNVLGSNGSVIPIFRAQIERGGPVTVTHPEITRFFMTIPEACQLVLEAATMGKGGEIFVFDMGEPVRITTLAEKMIKLAGFTPGKDIKIVFSGLRPGEKLYEELLDEQEGIIPTHHPMIRKATVRTNDYEQVSADIALLIEYSQQPDSVELLIRQMKKIVPEFASKNSVYEQFDQEF